MIKNLLIALYIILTAIVVAYIDIGIKSHNMDFYHGKDNGYFVRFESVVILNTFFYLLLTVSTQKELKDYLKNAVFGFITAIILSIVCYLIFLSADYYGLTFHIATITLCYSSYFALKKIKRC